MKDLKTWATRTKKRYPEKKFRRGQLPRLIERVQKLARETGNDPQLYFSMHLPLHLDCKDKKSFQATALIYSMCLFEEQDLILLRELEFYRRKPTINN